MASEAARIVALVCLVAAAAEPEYGKHHPTILVENIRRQLMDENYDYMSSESEEMFPIKHELSKVANSPPPTADRRNLDQELNSDINNHFISRTNDVNRDDFENDNSHALSKKDLLYYLDDDRLRHDAAEKDVARAMEETTTTVEESTSPKVKYKVLKVKDPHPNRRSQAFKRFIQEEREDGVAIINLNDEPLPEFRLPRARRQYMMDQHDIDSEIEIAPPEDLQDG